MSSRLCSPISSKCNIFEIVYLPTNFAFSDVFLLIIVVNPPAIAIYGNKVVQFLLGDDYFAFVIESKELVDNYRQYHKYLWDNLAKP